MIKSNFIKGMLQICIGAIAAGCIGMQKVNAAQVTLDDSPQNLTNSEILFNNGSPSLTAGRETTLWIQAFIFCSQSKQYLKKC